VTNVDDLTAEGRAKLWHWHIDEALACFEAAIAQCPDATAAHYLRGEGFFLQRRLEEALRCHAEALCRGMDRDIAARGRAMSGLVPGDFGWMSHMLRGDFESAWRLADRDRAMCCGDSAAARLPRHMRPVWDGKPLAGRHVLVRCYHGLGDTIHFIRYVPILAERAASVCVEVQPALLELLREVPGIDRLYALQESVDPVCSEFDCDAEIDVTELPHAFRTTIETIPAGAPYLRADPARRAAMAQRFAPFADRHKVGLCWAAGGWRPERSLSPRALMPLVRIPDVTFISLQRGPAYEDWRAAPDGPPIAGELTSDSVEETAAVISSLDLVITVDTMVAHLAGALGVPVWLLLHDTADWRWLLDREDSPWYPTMRLFRQPRHGDWASVVAAVTAALAAPAKRR
jgi:glycosyl transferase family 9 (putative heptosyltransferase)